VLKDEIYKIVIRDFIRRLEQKTATLPAAARPQLASAGGNGTLPDDVTLLPVQRNRAP
jgi:hypothetical protein